jgi:aminoglycoside phosphotransferase (APT) family kinase protein
VARTYYALVPNAARTAVLVAGGTLPVVHVETRHQFKALELLRSTLRLPAAFLRVAGRHERDEEVDLLNAFDAPPTGWRPEPPAEWLPLDEAEPATLAPAELVGAVDQWLEEQRGAPIDSKRPPWARAGWLEGAAAWVTEHAAVRADPELVRQWPLSAVYRFDSADGPVYLKAVFSLFAAEPAVTEALARAHPGDVPEVIATETERSWMLMRELEGKSARGEQASDGVRTAARIQRAWHDRLDELASYGCRRRGLEELAAESAALAPLCERLAAYGIPDSLVHGDLHHGNMIVRDDRVAVIDWSDAAIGHPFLDLAPVLWIGEKHRDALADAYVEAWADLASPDDLRNAAAIGEALGCVYQALSYRAINDAFEPADRWLFGDSYREWIDRAADLGKALHPG